MKKKALAKAAPVALPTISTTVATPELATKAHEGTPQYGDYGPAPDHRADGGDVYDLSHEQTAL